VRDGMFRTYSIPHVRHCFSRHGRVGAVAPPQIQAKHHKNSGKMAKNSSKKLRKNI